MARVILVRLGQCLTKPKGGTVQNYALALGLCLCISEKHIINSNSARISDLFASIHDNCLISIKKYIFDVCSSEVDNVLTNHISVPA